MRVFNKNILAATMLGLYSLTASAANLTVVDAASGEEVTITIPGEVDVTVFSDDS